MKKKVIFKTESFPLVSQTFVVNNVIEAIKNGFQIIIITNIKNQHSQSSQQELLRDFNIDTFTHKYTEPIVKKKRILKAFLSSFNPVLIFYYLKYIRFKKKKSLSLLFQLAFYFYYRKTTFHVHFANSLEPLLELKKIGFLKSKLIVTFHGYDAFLLPTGKPLEKLVKDYKMYVDHITVNSSYLKQILVEKGFPDFKINIVPIGLGSENFKPLKTLREINPPYKLITVARLVDLKGIRYGLQLLKKLIDKGQDVIYTVVGEGPEEERLKAMCYALGIESRVRFLGKKSQSEIKDLLEHHHLFLMVSTVDQSGRREAFGVVSLEAQAMELPVIGFKSGGFPETLVDGVTGFLVDDKDVEAMVDAVEMLINDKRRLILMGKAGRKNVLENFGFDKTTRKYLELY